MKPASDFSLTFVSGGDHNRNHAQVRLARSHAEHLNLDRAAGGPLDAAIYMPAGSCDSINCIGGDCKPVAFPSYTYRS